ncbi:hypothetical protein H1S01_03145 [Heliobacterium chlorum]|uniref:Uncharacterized protein n=1 Tax=Heliobacterium chlorum TaxID=2698 RepID=A0ABR7SZZ7_HELCL|nr:hypothetical protein [Heliobacterium chlorum]MBC9783507.1 hypothetical protein [Heliobacterium chlorum]
MSDETKFWRYSVPPEKGQGWGIFLLDSTGMFAAVTDYGNYVFKWTHHGKDDFRKFVIDVSSSPDYLLEKVAPHGEVYDGQETKKHVRETILQHRRDRSLSKDEARTEWELLDEYDLSEEGNFPLWYHNTSLCDAFEMAKRTYPRSMRSFAEKLMPRLATMIREEMEREGRCCNAEA